MSAVVLDHVLIPSHDKHEAARFLASMLDLEVSDESAGPGSASRFAVVAVGATTLDFDTVESFGGQHYAFAVDDGTFDAVLDRLRAAGIDHSADPLAQRLGEVYESDGGKGFYFRTPDGHSIELLTPPVTLRGEI